MLVSMNGGSRIVSIGSGEESVEGQQQAVPASEDVLALEEMSGARISVIGVGPGREQSVVVHDLV